MEKNHFYNLLRPQIRYNFFRIWKSVNAGEKLEDEEQTIGELMLEHTEYHNTWEFADVLANKEYDVDTEVNPFVHITLDAIVLNQINQHEPPEVEQTYKRLRSNGLSHLEAIHYIARVFIEPLWQVLKFGKPFDQYAYVKKLKSLM